ncbi:Clavaminate synthase-like protein [Meredithblackwellia eburnea MCA 4105]
MATATASNVESLLSAHQKNSPLAKDLAPLAGGGFVRSTAPFQRSLPSSIFPSSPLFPSVLAPSQDVSIDEGLTLIKTAADSGELKAELRRSGGALLIRGLPIHSANDFSRAVFATDLGVAHREVGRPPKRTVLAPEVVTANEGPAHAPIWTHNEYGWSVIFPDYLFFYALVPPTEGGETPINSGIELASKLQTQAPEFYDKLKRKGLKYHYRYTHEVAEGSNSGASIISAYGQNVLPGDSPEVVKDKVELEVRKHSHRFVWEEDGTLSVYHIVPCIRQTASGEIAFFGNLLSAYGRAKYHKALEYPFLGDDGGYHPLPLYGDGSSIDVKDMEIADKIVHDSRVLVKWQAGDILLFDNTKVQHARIPWKGERKVLASLWNGRPGESFVPEPWQSS